MHKHLIGVFWFILIGCANDFDETKKVIVTTKAPAAIGPYSQAMDVDGWVYCSGQIPIVPEDGSIVHGIEAQTKQVLVNLGEVLSAAG